MCFKIDIGVHTLFAIEQKKMCFSFQSGENITLLVNPPEQIVAEKLCSLARIGPSSSRYKDIDDIYYLITNISLNTNILKRCLTLLMSKQTNQNSVYDVINDIEEYLNDSLFVSGYKENGSWLNIEYETAKNAILDYLYKI